MDTAIVVRRVGEILIENGWNRTSNLHMIVNGKNFPTYEKTFDTAVGLKSAFICALETTDSEGTHVRMQGTYYSEGNNVLSGCSAFGLINSLVEKNVGIEAALQRYVEDAQRAIDQSYARRLFLTRDE